MDNIAIRSICAGAILRAAEKATWMAGEAIQALGGNGWAPVARRQALCDWGAGVDLDASHL